MPKSGPLTLGLIASSHKENERRVAIHPAHFERFDPETRKHVYAEKGFGDRFRIRDAQIEPHVAGLLSRQELFERCDAVMIFKPTAPDFEHFRPGQVLWGAVHCVQNEDIVQVGIDKKMTFLAMENMFLYHEDGSRGVWIYHTQSELAGYCSALHGLQIIGIKGWRDQPRKCAVISFGAAGRGACHLLQAMDFRDITVFTMRPSLGVLNKIPRVRHAEYELDPDRPGETLVVHDDGSREPFGEHLAGYDVIVNCVFQDTDNPLMFVRNAHLPAFKPGSLIVDVSCDRGMGFEFARPTTFDDPVFEVGDGVVYYGVDHSPSYLYQTASLEHSKSAWRYVKDVVAGPAAWDANPTVGRCAEIVDGVVVNPKILTFQNREEGYPHEKRG